MQLRRKTINQPWRRFGRSHWAPPLALAAVALMAGPLLADDTMTNGSCAFAATGTALCAAASDPAPAAPLKGSRPQQLDSESLVTGAYRFNRIFKKRDPGNGPFHSINDPDIAMPNSEHGPASEMIWISGDVQLDTGVAEPRAMPYLEAYPSILMSMTRLPSFKLRTVGGYDVAAKLTDNPMRNAVWGRFGGERYSLKPRPSDFAVSYDMSSFILEAGIDGLFLDREAGALIVGLSIHYQSGHAEISAALGTTTIKPEAYGLGTTILWLGSNGFYADAYGAHTRYKSTLQSRGPFNADYDNSAVSYALSVEIGQAIGIADDLSLVPQAQLLFSTVEIERFSGALSMVDGLSGGRSLVGRAGLTIESQSSWQNAGDEPRSASLYGLINIHNEFIDANSNLNDLSSDPDDITGEFGIGGSIKWQTGKLQASAFGEVTAFTGFNSGSYGYGGNIGLRLSF